MHFPKARIQPKSSHTRGYRSQFKPKGNSCSVNLEWMVTP